MWKRIITGVILAPAFLLAMFYLPLNGVRILIGLVLLGVTWEAGLLAGFRTRPANLIFTAILIIVGAAVVTLVPVTHALTVYMIFSGMAGFWWLVDIFVLSRFSVNKPGLYGSLKGRVGSLGLILLSTWFAINAMLIVDPRTPLLLVYVMVLVWIADSGAYFAGKFLGRNKLAQQVSPGKTIEGVIGGVVGVLIFASIFGIQVFNLAGKSLVFWVVLSVFAGLISVVGDLNESALKRVMGKKDSGSIIPGHGGFFDRADAITAAVPVFYFGWQLIHKGNLV